MEWAMSKILKMTTNYTALNVHEKIDLLLEQIEAIKGLLEKNQPPTASPQTLNLENAIAFMANEGYPLSKSSFYKLTSTSGIPFRRFGGKLMFDRDELLQWCKSKSIKDDARINVIRNLAMIANKKR